MNMSADKMKPHGKAVGEVRGMISKSIRQYAMYIALVIIIIFFSVMTKGSFLSAGNISNLFNQVGYIAILAIGMTLILIIRHIDLSVGFVAGFTGAIVAILMVNGINVFLAILIGLIIGLLIGLYQGALVAYVGVPAFVVTLAGQFIFRGMLLLTLQDTGTIIVANDIFNQISNGYLPSLLENTSFHLLTLIVGVISVILIVISRVVNRVHKIKYQFKVSSKLLFWTGVILACFVVMVLIWVLATYKGIPMTLMIVCVVLLGYNFVLNNTKLGRYIYGIGGNPEAALLSGINVKRVTLFCFASMGVLSALAGVLYTSRLQSAAPATGVGFELDAIASAFIGGVAVSGGVGRVTNTMVGALIIISLTNGMNLLYVDAAFQYIVKGAIFIIAVAFDVLSQNKSK